LISRILNLHPVLICATSMPADRVEIITLLIRRFPIGGKNE